MRTLRAVAFLVMALLPARWGAAAGVVDHGSTQALVVSGHRGPVLAIDHDDARNLLFTAGADGTVRIWDPGTRSLVRSIAVTSLRASMIAVDPADTRFAVLSTDALHTFSIDVWDWQKAERVFSLAVEDQPLFLRYSASGRYLVYGLPRWESLRIVNASDGSPVAFHPEGFGIVGFATFSRSEKIVMTYRLTGEISYWDLASGKSIESFASVPLLSHLRLSPDLSFIAGSTGSDVYLIDVATGAVRAQAPLSGVSSIDISAGSDQIACIAEGGTLSRWDFAGQALTRAPDAKAPQASVVRYSAGPLVLGSASGDLTALAADGSTLGYPGDVRALITGMAARGDLVALATASWIKVFTGGLPGAARGGATGSEAVQSFQVGNPFQAPVDLAFLDDDELLVWQTGQGPGAYGTLDIHARAFHPASQPLPSPVVEARVEAGRCLLLGSDGTLRIVDVPAGTTRLEIRRPGAMTAAFAAGTAVVVGGAAGDEESGSLVKINTATGETDPIRTRNRYTYEITYDPRTNTLYSVGVDKDGTTNLVAHSGADYQNESVIQSAPGEHLTASLGLDGATGALYSSLGHERISAWKQGSLAPLAVSARGTVRLLCASGLLYSLNRDSSVTISDAGSGRGIAELSLFADSGWALLLPDGKFAASAGAESHVTVVQDGKPVADIGAYLVPLQVAESH